MNTLDIVILAVTALFTLLGLKKGFIISLATLGGLFLGIYVALHFSNFFSGIIEKAFHPSASWLPAISFALTFLAVLIGVYILGKMVEKLVDMTGMGILNHLAGAILGMAKGIILLSVVFYLIGISDPSEKMIRRETKASSIFYAPVSKVFPLFMKILRVELKLPV